MNDENYLDQLKHEQHTAPDYLAARIIANAAELAPRDPWSELLCWFATRRLRGALAAVCPLVLGFVIGLGVDLNASTDGQDLDTYGVVSSWDNYEYFEEYGNDEI